MIQSIKNFIYTRESSNDTTNREGIPTTGEQKNNDEFVEISEEDLPEIEQKVKNKRKKIGTKKSKTQKFYNQITVVIRINHNDCEDINKEKTINVKLFKNGSILLFLAILNI